jgi:uncharacterized protein (TIGR00369 family)
MTLADGALTRTGLQWLRDAMNGTTAVPPFVLELGIRLERADKGLVIGTFDPRPCHLNGLATLHGGVIATLADTVASCAVLSIAPVGVITPTLEMKINFLRPATMASGILTAEGRLISSGRTTALAEARISDAQGRQISHATVTCSLIALQPEDLG